MPLFSRRRGSSATPPVDRVTHSNAAAAASQAFLQKSSPSHGALSSAAAAAALRSHTTSPEPVGSIQTKRMVRRGSQGSGTGSVRGGVARGGLQRRDSGGSMTERTFRSPSPGARGNGVRSPVGTDADVPPVPALPKGPKNQRSSSMDVPRRVASPTVGQGMRGSSVDRTNMSRNMPPKPTTRLSGLTETELEREESNRSVNFSRPIQSGPTSHTTPASQRAGKSGWFTSPAGTSAVAAVANTPRPKSSPGLSSVEKGFLEQEIQSAANKPPKQKRISSAPGSHLAQAKANDETSFETVTVYDPNSRTFVQRQKAASPEPDSPVKSGAGYWDPHTRTFVEPTRPAQPETEAEPVKKKPVLSPVDTTLEPPPRNPARLSPGASASPSSPRAQGFLHKQPSVVREDYEGERNAESSTVPPATKPSGGRVQAVMGPAKTYVAPSAPVSHQRSASLDVPRPLADNAMRGRQSSISPRRSAHFSDSPVVETSQHHQPGRSVSPIKSALKHSPSSSQRGSSPLEFHRGPSSDAGGSDTSFTSGDPKKKKTVRVSFDEQPQVQEKATALSHHVTSGREVPPAVDDEMDDLMKPRPALPSFGSVRKNRVADAPEKVTEQSPDRHDGMSSDHAIGGILANRQELEKPEPPEVTSKEGDGYNSDSSTEQLPSTTNASTPGDSTDGDLAAAAATADSWLGTNDLKATDLASDDPIGVPSINFQPPTPKLEDTSEFQESKEATQIVSDPKQIAPEPKTRENYFSVPGSWGEDEDEGASAVTGTAKADNLPAEVPPVVTGAAAGGGKSAKTAEPEFEMPVGSPNLSDIEESEDSAEFSDAAEELSDGEGFASLNAIVSSPVQPSPTQYGSKTSTIPESPSQTRAADDGDWTNATAYWSNLSRQQREHIERQHLSSDDERTAIAQTAKPRKSAMKKPLAVTQVDAPVPQKPLKQRPQGASDGSQGSAMPVQPALRKTMRGPAPQASVVPAGDGATHMRSSMRSGGGAVGSGMRSSMRDGGPKARPQSASAALNQAQHARAGSGPQFGSAGFSGNRARLSRQWSEDSDTPIAQASAFPQIAPKKNPTSAQLNAIKPPPIPNDSDSESSFRKRRRQSVSTVDSQGRFAMRRSMRGGSVDTRPSAIEQRPVSPPPSERKQRRSFLRSLSPTGSFMGRKKEPGARGSSRGAMSDTGVRTTLRSNRPTTADSGRKQGFASMSSGRPATATTAVAPSRFADSDDEDHDVRRRGMRYTSRFADSDDDEPASPSLAPVRGIPRRSGREDGDSTDLSDEDNDDPRKASRKREKMPPPLVPSQADVDKAMEAARRNLGMTNGDATTTENAKASTEGSALNKGSLRQPKPQVEIPEQKARFDDASAPESPTAPKKKGFMGSILRRNRDSSMSIPQGDSTPVKPTAAADGDSSVQQSPATPTSPSSKLLLRKSRQPRMQRGDSNYSNATAPAASSAYQNEGDSWPLPPVPAIPGEHQVNGVAAVDKERPNTSDGISSIEPLRSSMRPGLSQRASSQRVSILAPEDERDPRAIYSSRTGKKKKFSMLRRAFGLND